MSLFGLSCRTQSNYQLLVFSCRGEAQRQVKQIAALERDREKYGLEASDANTKYMQVGIIYALGDIEKQVLLHVREQTADTKGIKFVM